MTDVRFQVRGITVRVLDGPYVESGTPNPAAHAFAAELVTTLDELRSFAAQQLLSKYDDQWREEESPALTEDEFCARLTEPSMILFDDLGFTTIYFKDSDMFAGHSIEVSVDEGEIAYLKLVG